MSKSKRSNKAAEGSMSATITWSNGKEAFSAQDIYVTVQGESFSILGSTYVDDDTDYTEVDIWLPQNGRDKPTHKIAPGEDKPTGAHLGSTKIPRTGYAQNGILNILNWDPVSKQFEAAFDFTVQDDNQNDTRVVGTVWVKELDVLR